MFNGFKHFVVPVFGLLANLGCMLFYIIGPFSVAGMSWHEPFIALGVALVWGIYGAIPLRDAQQEEGEADVSSPPLLPYELTKFRKLSHTHGTHGGSNQTATSLSGDVVVCFLGDRGLGQEPRWGVRDPTFVLASS